MSKAISLFGTAAVLVVCTMSAHGAAPDAIPASWYGESVGRENGDTQVIDTIAITDKTFVDNYRTPHTDKMHVIERRKIIDNGNAVEVSISVEDPGAFTTPWSATQRWRRVHQSPMVEIACNENNANYLEQYRFPMPAAEKPDF